MKKELLIASLFTATVASAGSLTTSNTMGFVPISSSLAKGEGMYLVTPPFSGYDAATSVAVSDVIQTANLAEGDELFIPNGEGYDNYRLKNDKTWEAVKKVTISGGSVETVDGTPSTSLQVPRGSGFFVKTSVGQVNLFGNAETSASAVTVKQGWSMIGSSVPTGSTAVSSFDGATGDMILLADGTRYVKQSTEWKKYVKTPAEGGSHWTSAGSDAIPAGVAFWYKSATATTKTF